MNTLFTRENLPMTLIIALIGWAWFSLVSVLVGKLF
jgi:hypothetical protein